MNGEQHTEATRYFDELFARKPDGLTVVVWVKAADAKRTTYALNAESAAKTAADAEGDVYAGVGYAPSGASRDLGPKRRPGKNQVAGIVGLWCDVDVNGGPEGKAGAAPDRETALMLIEQAPLKPTMIVDSGYGLQPYWLFAEPWLFTTPEDRAGATALAAKWYERLRGIARELDPSFGIDGTADVSRVLRVPGTYNLKGGQQAPVRLLHVDESARYELADIEPHVAEVQLALSPALSRNGAASASADDIAVDVRADADPPFEKFEALIDVDDLFASAWNRARQDERAASWSASEWDMALCDRGVRARWADQELTDLMVAARRKHGDDLKRPDYYARTIARARATITVQDVEARRQEAIAELTAPPVSAADDDPEHVLALFEQVVNVPLKRFVQYGRDPDEGGVFELHLAGKYDGRRVRLPSAKEVLDFAEIRRRIVTVTHVLPPPAKREEWESVVGRLFRVVEMHEAEGETAVAVVEEWLRDWRESTEGGDRTEALRHGYPHVHDGRLYLSAERFRTFVRTRYREQVLRRDMQAWLRAAGFTSEAVPYRKANGKPTTANLYSRPEREGT